MRVLMVRPLIEKGGSTRIIIQLVEGLAARGVEVIVASQGGEWLPLLEKNVPCRRIPLYPSSPANLARSIVALRKIIQAEKIDLINTHHRFAALASNIASRFSRTPVISTVHEMKSDKSYLSKLTIGGDTIVFSQAVKQHLLQTHNIPLHRIFVVPMGVSIQLPAPQIISRTREELELVDSLPIIACVARLSAEKGCAVYLEAVAKMIKAGYKAQFLLVGDGPSKLELISLAQKLDISEYLLFTGWQDNVAAIIAHADFLVLPSLSEALGMTILEGFVYAKPTIASNVGGIPEVIQHGKSGLLIAPGDPAQLAQAIMHLLDDPEFTKQLGRFGQQEQLQSFSLDAMVTQTMNVYQTVLNRSETTRGLTGLAK